MSRLHPRGAGRRHNFLRGGFLALGTATSLLVAGGPAHADVVRAHVVKLLTPVVEIESDGKVYTEPTIPLMQIAASVNVHLDALVSGRIKGFKTWLQFRTENSDWAKFPQHAYSTSFPYEQRPKTYDKDVYVSVPYGSHASYLVSYCNLQANALRHDGMTDEQIFAQDRPIEVGVHAGLEADMSGVDASGSDAGTGSAWTNFPKLTVVCKARDPQRVPAPPPVSNDPTRDKPEVLEADLAIVEQHSLRGACSVHLSGVIRTSEPSTEVKFRYRSGDGKESDLKTVTSDHTAMAMFSHEYPLSSGGVKSGKVRIVGTSSTFASHWQEYEVDCGSPAQGYASSDPTPPDLTMLVGTTKEKLYKGFICPAKVGLDTRILANDPMEGRAIHIATQQGIMVEPQQQVSEMDFKIVKDQKFAAGASFVMKWSNVPVVGDSPPKQTMKFIFQAARHHTVIAEIEETVVLSCRKPEMAGVAQGAVGGVTSGKPAPTSHSHQTFAIQAPKGLVRKGEIRLSGGAANAKYTLKFLRKNGGGYVAVNAAQLPKQMTGLVASFPLKALTGGRDWRLEVCPDGVPSSCKTADFRLTRIGGAGAGAKTPAPEQPQSTIFLVPGVSQ